MQELSCYKGIEELKSNKGVEYAIVGMMFALMLANYSIYPIFVEYKGCYSKKMRNL